MNDECVSVSLLLPTHGVCPCTQVGDVELLCQWWELLLFTYGFNLHSPSLHYSTCGYCCILQVHVCGEGSPTIPISVQILSFIGSWDFTGFYSVSPDSIENKPLY